MSTTIYSAETKSLIPLFPDASGYYHLIYMIVNKINNKIYIGKHTTKNPYDDYMGSGKAINAAIKKYGSENFEKTILYCFDSEEAAYQKEAEIVTENFLNQENTYNLITGGMGWSSNDVKGAKNPMYNVHRYGKDNPFFNKKHSEETRLRMSLNHADFSGEKHPQYGKNRSNKTKQLISKNHADVSGKNNPFYGKGYMIAGKNNPRAKIVQKLSAEVTIVTEYGCMKECYETENMSKFTLSKIINTNNLYNGFYYRFKK